MFLAKWLGLAKDDPLANDSLQKIVTSTAVDRRRNVRVRYPDRGAVGGLPRIFYNKTPFPVYDISIGGVCLIDEENLLGESSGKQLELVLAWRDRQEVTQATIVGINLDHRNIQFEDISPAALVRINMLLKPGFLGTKFRQVDMQAGEVTSKAYEVWISPTGESVSFFSDENQRWIKLHLLKTSVRITGEQYPVFDGSDDSNYKGEQVSQSLLKDILVCLANFKKPSRDVLQLIDNLEEIIEDESTIRLVPTD